MPSRIRRGSTVSWRMGIYRRLNEIPALRTSYARKFAVAAFVGAQVPLVVFIVYLLAASADWARMYPLLAALVLASVMSFLGTLWLLRHRRPSTSRPRPCAPILRAVPCRTCRCTFPTRPASSWRERSTPSRRGTRLINRLELTSDADDLTGLYNRRAGEKRLMEEIARANAIEIFPVRPRVPERARSRHRRQRAQRGGRLHHARGLYPAVEHASRRLALMLHPGHVRARTAPQPRAQDRDEHPACLRRQPLRNRGRKGDHAFGGHRRGRISLRFRQGGNTRRCGPRAAAGRDPGTDAWRIARLLLPRKAAATRPRSRRRSRPGGARDPGQDTGAAVQKMASSAAVTAAPPDTITSASPSTCGRRWSA